MANEFKHGSVGTELTQGEYESVGGHVFDSQAVGDIPYAISTTQISRLGIGAENTTFQVSSGGIPEWVAAPTLATGTTIGNITLANGSITDSSGAISFGNENLSTTGALSIASMGGNWTNAGRTVADMGIVTTIDINGGTIDGAVIGGASAAAVSGTTGSFSTSLALATGATVTGIDNGALGSSATLLATQGAVKTYVDAQVTASDLDFQGDSGGALSIDLDSETLDIAGGTGIDTVGGTNTLTVNIDSTVATLAGSQTLTNKTLTAPTLTTPALGTPASGVLTNATGYTGDTSLVTTGVLNSGSINTGFGVINNGASAITTTGLVSAGSLTVTGTTTLNGNLILGDAAADTLAISATIQGATPLIFEGASAGDYETSFAITNPSADRTITFPDATLTVNAAANISGATLASNVLTSSLTTVGALNAGSITSGFTSIDVGSGTIDTTGAVSTGALTPSSIAYTGNLYFTGTLTTASNTNNYMVRFNEADSSVIASANNSGTGTSGYGFVVIDGEAIAAASSLTFAESSSLMITGPPTAGTNMTLTQTFALNVVAGDVSIAPTAKLFLDGGGDTYIYQESADDLHVVVGGVAMMQIDQDLHGGTGAMGFFGQAPIETVGAYWSSQTQTIGVNKPHEIMQISGEGGAITTAGSGTTSRISTLHLREPNITIGTAAVTLAATLYIGNAPTEATTNAAIAVPVKSAHASNDNAVLLGDAIGVSTTTGRVKMTMGNTNGRTEFFMGQSSSRNLTMDWIYNATAANAYGRIFTNGNSNVIQLTTGGQVNLGNIPSGTGTWNTNMTVGLTINQGANDDEILALKSSDVAHGMTSLAETDSFYIVKKDSATGGGMWDTSFSELRIARLLRVYSTSEDTSDTSGSNGNFQSDAYVKSGTTGGAHAATGNMFAWTNAGTTRMLLKGNGVLHVTNTTLVALDDQPDALVVRAMQKDSSHSGIIEGEHDNPFYNGQWLRDNGLLGDGAQGDALFAIQPRMAAHEGAIWQNYVLGKSVEQKHMSLAEKVDGLEVELIEAKKQLAAISA
jgi:hypothetical protein